LREKTSSSSFHEARVGLIDGYLLGGLVPLFGDPEAANDLYGDLGGEMSLGGGTYGGGLGLGLGAG